MGEGEWSGVVAHAGHACLQEGDPLVSGQRALPSDQSYFMANLRIGLLADRHKRVDVLATVGSFFIVLALFICMAVVCSPAPCETRTIVRLALFLTGARSGPGASSGVRSSSSDMTAGS